MRHRLTRASASTAGDRVAGLAFQPLQTVRQWGRRGDPVSPLTALVTNDCDEATFTPARRQSTWRCP
jgi:hypothetical protein